MTMLSLGAGLTIGPPVGGWPHQISRTSITQDAANEMCGTIGQVLFASGPGTSKTFSAAGGASISMVTDTTVTWLNAGTTVRVGVQGVTLGTGLEDGVFTLYGDIVGGVDAVSNSTITTVDMSSGSITLTHGDLIAVVVDMLSRGGADSNRWLRAGSGQFPYGLTDVGAGSIKSTSPLAVMLTSDDGTVATFSEQTVPTTQSEFSYNSGSTPDEYALLFSLPFSATTNLLGAQLGEIDAGETGDLILYSDPLGSPIAERTAAIDPVLMGSGASTTGLVVEQIQEFLLQANVLYGIAHRPTTASARVTVRRYIGAAAWREFGWLGRNQWGGTRTDQTGPFTASATSFPLLGCWLNSIDIIEKMPRTRIVRSL